jgi:hydrogenase maturation protein HypF
MVRTGRSSLSKKAAGTESPVRLVVSVHGVVQGVGFRPFVYQLVTRHGLRGWVCNTSEDVRIDIEGAQTALDRFLV